MKRWLANQVSTIVAKRGYVISRPRFHDEQNIDVRGLLAATSVNVGAAFTVVQVGANDGITNDPINHLVKARGWSLIAIEPLPGPFKKLQEHYSGYSNVRCIQCAIGNEDGDCSIYTLRPRSEQSEDDHLSSFSIDVLRKHWRRVPDLDRRIISQSVKTRRLWPLLQELDVSTVDMLQIDAEGFDYEIIKLAFGSGLFPAILAFEWEHLTPATMWECRCDLIKFGYRWVIVKGDVIAARAI